MFQLKAQTTVVDVVVNSADHTILEAAVIAAELADDLSGDGSFTLFAPTDAAPIRNLPQPNKRSIECFFSD